jgi:hypothetical protein
MNTLPLTKHLPSHDDSPLPALSRATTTELLNKCRGLTINV